MSGGVCNCSGFGVLLGRGWCFGSCCLVVSFGGGFGILKIVELHCESIYSSLLDSEIGCLQNDWHKLYIACSFSM